MVVPWACLSVDRQSRIPDAKDVRRRNENSFVFEKSSSFFVVPKGLPAEP